MSSTPFVKSFFQDQQPAQQQPSQQQPAQQQQKPFVLQPSAVVDQKARITTKSKSLYDTLDTTTPVQQPQQQVKEQPKDIQRIVTVFGFPMEKAQKVLQKLNRSIIVDCVMMERWLHVEFSDIFHAQIALSQSGELMVDGFLVGVTAYREQLDANAMNSTPLSSRKKGRLQESPSGYADQSFQSQPSGKSKMKQVGQRFDPYAPVPIPTVQYKSKMSQVDDTPSGSFVSRLVDAVLGW